MSIPDLFEAAEIKYGKKNASIHDYDIFELVDKFESDNFEVIDAEALFVLKWLFINSFVKGTVCRKILEKSL